MIYINLQLTNPWSDFFKVGRVWYGKVTEHKCWEIQAMRTNDIAVFKLDVTARRDHAGVDIEFGLLSFNLLFRIYDNRHWDNELNAWSKYD